MKLIALGLQCPVAEGIKQANMKVESYPFDWIISPSKTTYTILTILLKDGIEKAIEYMTTGYTYYISPVLNVHTSVDYVTVRQMNKNTGLGISHFVINDDFKNKLRRRFERFLNVIQKNEDIMFIYADAVSPTLNYSLDGVIHGEDATEYLSKIYDLIHPINPNIKILYFCWNERKKTSNNIEHIGFNYLNTWPDVVDMIKNYLLTFQKQKQKKLLFCPSALVQNTKNIFLVIIFSHIYS
jgi:hypothetical protein